MSQTEEGVPVRRAATVVVMRDGDEGLGVWLQRRAYTLAFAAGMYAFPGGALDPGDFAATVEGVDLDSHRRIWGDPDESDSLAHLAAAVRETFEETGLALDPSRLLPWSRWVTPAGEVRRFDARFYVSPCPVDQHPRALTEETADGRWMSVTDAVAAYVAGRLPMWPPTITTMRELLPFREMAEVFRSAPGEIEAVTN